MVETEVVLKVTPDRKDIVRIRNKLGRFVTNLPRYAKRDSYNIAKSAGKALEFSARSAGIKKWRGLLFNMLNNPARTGESSYSIYIPEYGFYLDRMREHYVPRRATMPEFNLWMWAEEKFGGMPPFLRVKPHPWIAEGLRKARLKARSRFREGRTVRETKKLIGR